MQSKDTKKIFFLKTRLEWLQVILGFVILLIFGSLVYLQGFRYSYYKMEASNEQVKRLAIPAKRGQIYGMSFGNPVPLVLNEPFYDLFVDPTVLKKHDEVYEKLMQVAGGNLVSGDIRSLMRKTGTQYVVLAKGLSRRQKEMIEELNFYGVGFKDYGKRFYPEGNLASQVLGFVNSEGNGQYGVEGFLDSKLRGKDGVLKTVTDISNTPLSIGNNNISVPVENGKDVVLTIDRNVQYQVEKVLEENLKKIGANKGSVIVMDPQTGHVLSMANFPTYNPSEYNKVTDASDFINGTISMPYEPGSVIKTFTVATGINEGAITPNSTYVNTDSIKVDDITITNSSKGQLGTITMQHALNWSLNTGMVTIAERLGDGSYITRKARDTIYDYDYNRFRLGKKTGIELSGEQAGRIISPDEEQGNAVRYSNMSFGQGLDLTMVQVVSAFSAVVNGGKYYKPTVIAGSIDDQGKFVKNTVDDSKANVIKPETSETVKNMLVEARGVFKSRDKKGYTIGGKTGTSQTIESGNYNNDQTIGTYLGFGGDDTPRYVIMVQVSGKNMNLEGGKHAQPIFTEISNWMLNYLKIKPKE